MKTLTLKGIRSFGDRQEIPIRPVTLLVGENSTGKSTVLAMVRAAWDLAFSPFEPDFNASPFELGGYDAMAYYHGGQGKRAHELLIEATFEAPSASDKKPQERHVRGAFTERNGQPTLARWSLELATRALEIHRGDQDTIKVIYRDGEKATAESVRAPRETPLTDAALLAGAFTPAISLDVLALFPRFSGPPGPRPLAAAPIRSRARRTYNPTREFPDPEGSHAPLVLATLQLNDPATFTRLTRELREYGRAAGLFSDVKVKRLGKKAGDPFQLLVSVDKHAFNVLDVGYGVSQILPVLVDALQAPEKQIFLWQQPEVHLHPRAQAELGSLLVRLARARHQTFVVETHSDYLVDRVRMDVSRTGPSSLRPEDVVILYFERGKSGKSKVHPIHIDAAGDLVDAPKGYRRFFLDEERRFLRMGSAS